MGKTNEHSLIKIQIGCNLLCLQICCMQKMQSIKTAPTSVTALFGYLGVQLRCNSGAGNFKMGGKGN